MQSVPAGYSIRRPTLDDGPNTYAVIAAHNVPLIGQADFTLEDAIDQLKSPDFELSADGWLVNDGNGEAVGWARAGLKSKSNNADFEVYTVPGHADLAAWLWETVQSRAVDLARAAGHRDVVLDTGIYPEDKQMREIATRFGYAPAARFMRMKIDHVGPVPVPPAPSKVELRHGTSSETVRRDSLDLRNRAFFDHFGFVAKNYEEWVAQREASSLHDWSLVHVAYVDGSPAATLVRTNHFVAEENLGYVMTLGTAPQYQGRGLAGFLLGYAFAADAALGRDGTVLDVDSNPERPALGLYQRAGMRQIMTIDDWRKLADI
jgi:ribosomal protein S18 acetylase RimI-like enzyme